MPEQSNSQPRKAAASRRRAPRTNTPSSSSTTPSGAKTRKRTTARKPAGPARPTPEQIRDRAYYLYVERGYQHGDDQADWYRAEQELLSPTAG